MSASSQTIVAALPPSSSTSRLRPAARATASPVAALPVKLITATSSAAHSRRADVAVRRAAAGPPRPASRRRPAAPTTAAELAGACGGALTIVVFPAANDAPSLCASRFAGALNGRDGQGDARRAPGRSARCCPTPRAQPATGSSSPPIRRASAAQTASVSATRSISPRPSLTGLPSSSASSVASWSRRSAARRAARSRTSARAAGPAGPPPAPRPARSGRPGRRRPGRPATARLTTRRRYGPVRCRPRAVAQPLAGDQGGCGERFPR